MHPNHWSLLLPTLRLLGYGGLIPFFALAIGGWGLADPLAREICVSLLQAYGLSIISFVGALSWGMALVAPQIENGLRKRLAYWSVTPSLVGFASFVFPTAISCLILAATALFALLVDLRNAPRLGLPPAWQTLRWHLSLGAIAALILGSYAATRL